MLDQRCIGEKGKKTRITNEALEIYFSKRNDYVYVNGHIIAGVKANRKLENSVITFASAFTSKFAADLEIKIRFAGTIYDISLPLYNKV